MAEEEPDGAQLEAAKPSRQERSQALSNRKLEALRAKQHRRGVLYINRIPPHMKPQKLRHLLSQHGKLGRIYLAPEDSAVRTRRKKHGGDTGKHFSEGWVEFEDKREAKQAAELLNNNPIGGRKRSAYHYDLWCLKYLPKFKWDHLTEEIAYQNAVREQRLAQEVSAATRERDFYLTQVSRAKGIAAQEDRKRKRAEQAGAPQAEEHQAASVAPVSEKHRALRAYGQRKPKLDPVDDRDAPMLSQDVMSLLAGRRSAGGQAAAA